MFDLKNVIVKDISKQKRGDFKFNGQLFHFVYENDQKAEDPGAEKFIVCHWTAMLPNYIFDGYDYCIAKVKGQIYIFKCLPAKAKGQHLWNRNTDSIGIAFCRMSRGDKPEPDEITTMAALNAELCAFRGIDPHKKISHQKKLCNYEATEIWDVKGTILVDTVSDHKTFAVKDGYKRWRYDIDDIMPDVLKQTRDFYDDLKAAKPRRQFLFKAVL